MKNNSIYEEAEINIIRLSDGDIIETSGGAFDCEEDEFPKP